MLTFLSFQDKERAGKPSHKGTLVSTPWTIGAQSSGLGGESHQSHLLESGVITAVSTLRT